MASVSDDNAGLGQAKDYTQYVPEQTDLKELTIKAVVIGVVMAMVLGAANAYLGLKAGITVAATFPAAVVGMAVLRMFKGSILEENLARTTGSVGEALAAGAIFTLPAFLITGVWEEFNYMEATAFMLVGGLVGVMFVILLRRILVEESGLPFPESVEASQIHIAGQAGATGASYVFGAMGISALIELFKNENGFTLFKEYVTYGSLSNNNPLHITNLETGKTVHDMSLGGGFLLQTPSASPALWGVGYIIGPRLASITFSGGVLGWMMFVPLIMLFSPGLVDVAADPAVMDAAGKEAGEMTNWMAQQIWFFAVRPFAVGAMLVGAAWTLWSMRKKLMTGIGRAVGDLMKSGDSGEKLSRFQKDLPFKLIFSLVGILVVLMALLYWYLSHDIVAAIVSAIVMAIAGFFFAAVAGYLVGLIGSSNNPISGLTLSTLIIAALLLVIMGVPETLEGVAAAAGMPPETGVLWAIGAVLGVATVVCCSCGVAGDMMQDLKVGHILGGTPWKMQSAEIIGVIGAALVMAIPLMVLHEASLTSGTGGIGGTELPAPQAGLMAMLSKGIISGDMAWPLVILGMLFSVGMILIKSPSPMLIAIGMYLPLHTTFAIFVGGLIRYVMDMIIRRKKIEGEAKEKAENTGTLLASGFIAGEALMAIILAGFVFGGASLPAIIENPGPELGIVVLLIIGGFLIFGPLKKAKAE